MRDTTIDEMDAEMMGYGGVMIFFRNIYIFAVTASFYQWSHMFYIAAGAQGAYCYGGGRAIHR